jgi:hypothetical protein
MSAVAMATVNDDLWMSGQAPGSRPGLMHLPAAWLSPVQAAPDPTGETTTVWPGQTVVWLQDGIRLSCLSASTGRLLTTASNLIGPVVSGLGYAYVVSNGEVHVLDLRATSCRQG